jgi:hypothetical protein
MFVASELCTDERPRVGSRWDRNDSSWQFHLPWGRSLVALVWRSRLATLAIAPSALISVSDAAPLVLGPEVRAYAQDMVPALLACGLCSLVSSACRDRLGLAVGRPVDCLEPSAISSR